MATKNIVPRANGEGSLGTSAKKWGAIYANEIVLANEQTLETKLNEKDAEIDSKLAQQDSTISTSIASQDEVISTRLNAQDAAIDSRLNAQDESIAGLDSGKLDKNQVSANADKVLMVDADGNVVPKDAQWATEESVANVANDLVTTQGNLQALAENTDVVASGEGYVRYANGLQICWARSLGANAAKINFNQSFKDVPSVTCTVAHTGTDVSNSYYTVMTYGVTTTGCTVQAFIKSGTDITKTSNNIAIGLIAVGLWK